MSVLNKIDKQKHAVFIASSLVGAALISTIICGICSILAGNNILGEQIKEHMAKFLFTMFGASFLVSGTVIMTGLESANGLYNISKSDYVKNLLKEKNTADDLQI
jgi:hypothetical protein